MAKVGKVAPLLSLEFTPTDPLEGLRTLAVRMPALASRAFRRRALKMRPRYLAMFKVVPPDNDYPTEWESDLQRVAFFASDGFGGGIPTVRDNSYVDAFEMILNTDNFDGLMNLVNNDEGAPYIGGDLQQQMHKNTGWLNVRQKATEIAPLMADELEAEFFLLADPVAALADNGGFPVIEEHYLTLKQARDEMGSDNATDQDYTFRTLPQMSREITNHKHAHFEPVYRTVTLYPSPATVLPGYRVLQLIDPVNGWHLFALDIESITNGSRALTWGDDVAFFNGQRDRLYMLKTCDLWTRNAAGCSSSSEQYAVTLTGWFGYRRNYPIDGWHQVDTLHDGIDADDLALILNGTRLALGFDGRAPRLSPGHLIKIGSGDAIELMRVMYYDILEADNPSVPIRRGENNSTPVAHLADAPIYVWSVQPEIIHAAQRWVDLRYDRRGTFDTREISDGVAIDHPGDMPTDVRKILGRLQI